MLWIISYTLVSYGEIEDFEVKGIFKGSKEDVVDYVKKLNEKTSLGRYEYCLAKMLN
jgi:hypothetical protein